MARQSRNKQPKVKFKQARAEKTHQTILRAAAKVFARKGFDKTQTPELARAAGISTGALYRYFTDKREVFLAMLELHLNEARNEVAERLRPEYLSTLDPPKAVQEVLDTFFEQAARDPALTRVYLAMSLTDKDVSAIRTRAENEDRTVVAALITAGVPHARIDNPHAAALIVQSATLAAATECALGHSSVTSAEAKKALGQMLGRYLFGEA
jgi:AcrR family transcriptional regulator